MTDPQAPLPGIVSGGTIPEDPALWATEPLRAARFEARPNRFVVHYRQGRRSGQAHVANPGRMDEILLPGTALFLAPRPHTRLSWEAVGARWTQRWEGDRPRVVFLNTGRVNQLARALLDRRLVPELASYTVVRQEIRHGHSRFDFLLEDERGSYLLEVKSVTLNERGLAYFPDARSARACRHLEALARAGERGRRAGVLFLVQGAAEHFLPDFHNDLDFARVFRRVRKHVEYLPYGLDPSADAQGRIVFAGAPRRLSIPWETLDTRDRGLYLLLLELTRQRRVVLESGSAVTLVPGWYVHVGTARGGLSRCIEAHRRCRKRPRTDIDRLRAACRRAETIPIRATVQVCALAVELPRLGGMVVAGFGASRCGCPGHTFRLPGPPASMPQFQELVTRWRHTVCMA